MEPARGVLSREIDLRPLWRFIRDRPVDVIFWLGVLLRIVGYLSDRSYWMDEASLLGNLAGMPVFVFSGHLQSDQLAPFGFMIVERTIITLLGSRGYVTRFVPLVCGIVALGLFRRLTFRCLPFAVAMVAFALFAFSDDLVYYSSELKPYSSDLALGLAITIAAWRVLDQSLSGRWRLTFLLLVVLAPWLSFPSVFIVAGCGMILLIDRCLKRRWTELGVLLAIALGWLASFVLAYRASHALLPPATTMYVFWNFAFLPVPPGSRTDLIRLGGVLLDFFVNPLNLVAPFFTPWVVVLPVLLVLIGGLSLPRRDWRLFLILGLPILLALVAAVLKKYPFHGRLAIDLVPAFFVMMAEGTQWVRVRFGRPAYVVLLILVLAIPCLSTFYEATGPRLREFNAHGDLHKNRFVE